MGTPGLIKVDKSVLLNDQAKQPAPINDSNRTGNQNNIAIEIARKHSVEIVSIVKDIVQGQLEIAKTKAQTDAQLQLIEKEMEKIWQTTNAEIAKMEAEGREWEKKFDKKAHFLTQILQNINSSQLDKDVKLAAIEAVKSIIGQ